MVLPARHRRRRARGAAGGDQRPGRGERGRSRAGTVRRHGTALPGPRLRGTPAARFRYDTGGGWSPVGLPLDTSVLSDEHAEEIVDGRIRSLGFTGAFAGLCAWDLAGGGLPADFDEAVFRDAGAGGEGPAAPGGGADR
ncbi:hypothetical protein RND61_02605 [Streptomyces sp. TRM76323]|uniref:Beta-xylosidase C-terminal Concanavalin A-like domain-containing protein n=1 Tax=Streptomyces tamarix TaxID=3078565 RepID=A0ABU3QE01_9ACTN|nr:hypothetical protein [Streptomyces tamarix]MDT9680984.1 hypothetical protein [Streptomyces tamarix]